MEYKIKYFSNAFDTMFIGCVKEISGICAGGDTLEELRDNLKQELKGYLERQQARTWEQHFIKNSSIYVDTLNLSANFTEWLHSSGRNNLKSDPSYQKGAVDGEKPYHYIPDLQLGPTYPFGLGVQEPHTVIQKDGRWEKTSVFTNINNNMETTTKRQEFLKVHSVEPKNQITISEVYQDDERFIKRHVQDCENALDDAKQALEKRMKSLTALDASVISNLYFNVSEAESQLALANKFKEAYF